MGCSIWGADTKGLGFDFKHPVKLVVSCVSFFALVPRKLRSKLRSSEISDIHFYVLTLSLSLSYYSDSIFAISLFVFCLLHCVDLHKANSNPFGSKVMK